MQGLDPPGGMMDLVRLQSPVRSPCQEGTDLPWRHSRTCLDPRSSGSEGPQWEQAKQLRADALPSAWCQEAWGEAADSLVASELATIYQLVKAKSDRILGKEKELQRSECMVAQVVGAAKARLRADVEDLLRISKQELRKEANLQKKRLEELFQKAQDEFRKAVTWRKEARALKGAVDLERDNHEKLQKKIQELVRREKALRQQHAEEKERWAQEKEQLERRLALQNGVPAQESRIALRPKDGHFGRPVPKTVGAAPPDIADIQDHRRSLEEAVQFQAEGVETAAGRMESWNASTIGEGDPNPCSRCTHGTSVPQKPDAEISQCQLALWSTWWGVNSMVFGPRGLWGCAALLSAEPSRSQDPENWFLRRWVWHALLADATSMWQSASDKVQEEKKTSSRDVPPLRMEPFDLQQWLPQGRQRPFTRLRQHLQPHLVAESSEATKAGNKVLWLLPASSQQKVAGALWKDARQQLLSSEKVSSCAGCTFVAIRCRTLCRDSCWGCRGCVEGFDPALCRSLRRALLCALRCIASPFVARGCYWRHGEVHSQRQHARADGQDSAGAWAIFSPPWQPGHCAFLGGCTVESPCGGRILQTNLEPTPGDGRTSAQSGRVCGHEA